MQDMHVKGLKMLYRAVGRHRILSVVQNRLKPILIDRSGLRRSQACLLQSDTNVMIIGFADFARPTHLPLTADPMLTPAFR